MKALSESVFNARLWLDAKNDASALKALETHCSLFSIRFIRKIVKGIIAPDLDTAIVEAGKFQLVVAVSVEPYTNDAADKKGGEK